MKKTLIFFAICIIFGCKKKLDLKPNTNIILPKTAQELESILDYAPYPNNTTPALAQVSADEYYIPSINDWQSNPSATARNASIWQSDIYSGETKIQDWIIPYISVFYANSVLDILESQNINNDEEKKRVKGRALFIRAYSFYSLASVFSKGYDNNVASTELGIPLKLNSNVEETTRRATLKQTYERIIKDAEEAGELLNRDVIASRRNKPSKVAVHAFLARVYLSMRNYEQAEEYVDKALHLYSRLTDFKTLDQSNNSAFTLNSEETIYYTTTSVDYGYFYQPYGTYYIDPSLIDLYEENDLRLPIYFINEGNGKFKIKPINTSDPVLFSGLATDELFLIKAECMARRGEVSGSMDYLNQLGLTRWNPNATVPAKPYQDISASSKEVALDKVLIERRKALVFRSVRWTDIKRLNLEGRNITLTRNLSGQVYVIEPNSAKYALPIPNDEVSLSGLEQNPR